MQKKIIEWEKLAQEFQEKANHSYNLLDKKEEKKLSEIPSEIQEKTVINEITVYEYSDEVVNQELNNNKTLEESQQGKEKADFNTSKKPGEVVAPVFKTDFLLATDLDSTNARGKKDNDKNNGESDPKNKVAIPAVSTALVISELPRNSPSEIRI